MRYKLASGVEINLRDVLLFNIGLFWLLQLFIILYLSVGYNIKFNATLSTSAANVSSFNFVLYALLSQ